MELSIRELQRIKVIENAVAGRITVQQASQLLNLSERQIKRLKRRCQPQQVEWVRHGNRGKQKPWGLAESVRQRILELARGKYAGFNDSHLREKLVEVEQLTLSRETVRRVLRGAKIASPQKRRARQYRARRERKPRLGMMVLVDASRHRWLQERGPQLTLIGFQDDATGQVLAAHFQLEPENTLGYLRALRRMVEQHGIPLSLYRDQHSSFQRNDEHWTRAEELAGRQEPTQLGRVLDELGIQQIRALSPQAKGRIERLWRTFQDRLISELRLAGACTLEEANAVLQRFVAEYNRKFAVAPRQSSSDFRRLGAHTNRDRLFSLKYYRVVGRDHVIAFGQQRLQLPPRQRRQGYAGTRVELSHQLNGELHVWQGGERLLRQALPIELLSGSATRKSLATRVKPSRPQSKLPKIYA
jgi:transposase